VKILFLDNDGVICLSHNWGGRSKKRAKYLSVNPEETKILKESPVFVRFDDFDKKAVSILNEVLIESGAEIVVSSDWKLHATVEELGEYYESQGIVKRPLDRTLNLDEIDPESAALFTWKGWRERMRILEIRKYLEDHPEITHWVAIDDMNMSLEAHQGSGLKNFVHAPLSKEGIKQHGIKEKLLKFLE